MQPRNAVISFQCSSPGILQVTEMIGGKCIHHREVPRDPDVVAEIQERYMFFSEPTNIARDRLGLATLADLTFTFGSPNG